MRKLLIALFWLAIMAGTADAQSQAVPFFARFLYDDGTPISGQLFAWDQTGSNIVTAQTDALGRAQGIAQVDPSQGGYTGQFSYTNPQGQVATVQVAEPAFCTAQCASDVLAIIPTAEVVVTIAKASGKVTTALGTLPTTIAQITVSASPSTVQEGGTATLNATVYCGIWGCNQGVTWSATAGTLAGNIWTAPNTIGPVTITGTSLADPTQTITLTINVIAPPPPPPPPPSLSYVSATSGSGTATKLVIPIISAAGNTIYVATEAGGSGLINSVTDSAGNTYQHVSGEKALMYGAGYMNVYVAMNVAAAPTSVIVSKAGYNASVSVLQFAGATSIDGSAFQTATGQSESTATVTTTGSPDIVIGFFYADSGTISAGSGFAVGIANSSTRTLVEYAIEPNPGSYTATATDGAFDPTYGGFLVAIK